MVGTPRESVRWVFLWVRYARLQPLGVISARPAWRMCAYFCAACAGISHVCDVPGWPQRMWRPEPLRCGLGAAHTFPESVCYPRERVSPRKTAFLLLACLYTMSALCVSVCSHVYMDQYACGTLGLVSQGGDSLSTCVPLLPLCSEIVRKAGTRNTLWLCETFVSVLCPRLG